MAVTVYSSADASAPVLTTTAGSLIAVLDACLVVGYGSQLAAGWGKPYIGTNLAVFRQGTGNQMYLRIDDTQGAYSRVVGIEASTGINSNVGRFPVEIGMPGGLYWPKCVSVDAAARSWLIIATSKAFYLWINSGPDITGFGTAQVYFFGDITSYKTNDAFNTTIIGNTTSGTSGPMSSLVTSLSTVSPGHFGARSYTQLGSAIALSKHSDYVRGSANLGRGNLSFPNVIDGSVTLAPVWIHEPQLVTYPIRGTMPGMWNICHTAPFAHGDTFQGTGTLAGKTFQVVSMYYGGGAQFPAQCAIEITNTW